MLRSVLLASAAVLAVISPARAAPAALAAAPVAAAAPSCPAYAPADPALLQGGGVESGWGDGDWIAEDDMRAIDRAAQTVLDRTGVPSASIAVVKRGCIVYLAAYGKRDAGSGAHADIHARYGIGSISKQFAATAILMLAEEGKVSLDDPVGKYVPNLTSGDRITIRQVLSHTSGYRDYWPQDYVMDEMMHPATADHILDKWARIPLDFEPGAQWQYSNTGYTIAGQIVEKVTGRPYMDFVRERIFKPLHMTTATDLDGVALGPNDAHGSMRYALGPLHPAPKEAKGWLYAMGSLAMTPYDLAQWDVAQLDRRLLKPESYAEQFREVKLNDGKGSGYGLGVRISTDHGRRMIEHGGEISGFLAENRVYPDDKAAIVVLTNADFGGADSSIADRIADVLFPGADETRVARGVFDELREGRIDRSRFTPNANAYFSEDALKDFAASLGPLGEPDSFVLLRKSLRGGMTAESYRVTYADRTLRIILRAYPDGKIEQFLVQPSQ